MFDTSQFIFKPLHCNIITNFPTKFEGNSLKILGSVGLEELENDFNTIGVMEKFKLFT